MIIGNKICAGIRGKRYREASDEMLRGPMRRQ
jgi:hypothetical protein